MNTLGVILARGGSKRVPGKNLRPLAGWPLITWTIGAGRMASLIDYLVVSSDDADILDEAAKQGAEPIERPGEMATDEATSYPPLMHAVDQMEYTYEYVCLLQPTSPFRIPYDINLCVAKALHEELAAVVSVEQGSTVPNGAVYVGRVDWLRDALANGNRFPFDGPVPAIQEPPMPHERSLDIDTEDDWRMAEAMVEMMSA